MVVLCVNPECGAVLRVGGRPSRTEAIIESDAQGAFFQCPRCAVRTRLAAERRNDATMRRTSHPRA
jgi:hypothetical protein